MGRKKGPDDERQTVYDGRQDSPPGARIEVSDDYLGKTPITITIYGDKDGTCHNFGTKDYIIRAFPVTTNQYQQTKVFRTGGWFSEEDRIPSRIYFDMEQKNPDSRSS